MSGGTMSGNCSTGRLKSATSPPRSVSSEMTMATTGRLMKKRAIDFPLFTPSWLVRRSTLRRHRLPVFHPRESFDDHLLARVQPFLDDPVRADARAELHRPHVRRVVRADHGHLVDALQLVD